MTSHTSAFHAAVLGGFLEPLRTLVQYHVDVNTLLDDDDTALVLACSIRDDALSTTAVRWLLAHGADPNGRLPEYHSWTALHHTVDSIRVTRMPAIVLWLLAGGADADAADEFGKTPLMYSLTYSASSAVLPLLLAAGASFHAVDNSGKSALEYGWDNVDGWCFKVATIDACCERFAYSEAELGDARAAIAAARVEIEQARRSLSADRRAIVRDVAWPICVGLQNLRLPAFVTLCIVDEALCLLCDLMSMHYKWDVVCAVKHFHVRRRRKPSTVMYLQL
jgi:hypothetical protein